MESYMPAAPVTVEKILQLAQKLTPLEKLKLIERLAPQLEGSLQSQPISASKRGLRGVLRGSKVSEKEIDEARHELWGEFPREIL